MKKLIVFLMLFAVCGCVTVGKFPEKRNRLHELGNEESYCEKNPDRCIDGVAW